uniref:AMP-dependent synthetase/ligase domain-containing protein n=1 Tax=Magallana gigas TaxID=29159 RepID=A0A8W8MHF4_MAGGI
MAGSYLKCDTVLDIPYTSFPDLLKRRAVETPNKAACVFFYESNERYVLTFGDLYDRATKFAKALVQMGVKRGDIIGVSGRNVPEWLVAYFGVQIAGGCSLCLPFQQNETQIKALLKSIGDVKLLIIDAVETACKIMTKEKATQAYLVPSVLDLIIKNGFPLKIQRISTGSMVVKSSMLECVGQICDEFQNIYGTTELALIGSRIYTVDDKPLVNQGVVSCRPDPGVEVKVTDDEGFVQPIGQRGKIWIRTIRRFTGYLNHTFSPELTEYIIRSGWFSHDDGGYVTKDNSLIIEGRNQEMIEVLGRKIYPIEIEDVIKSKTNVIAAIVVPIKERETGHFVPSAAVVYRPQGEDSVESMQRYLRKQFNITAEDHLNEYLYVPSVIISVKEFPILANGKPNRKAVSQLIFDKIDSQRYDTS